MIAPSMITDEWRMFWHEGESFTRLCSSKAKHFTNEIKYNLAGMAVEKLIMAVLMRKGTLPEGHTLNDLMNAAEEAGLVSGSLCEGIKRMDDFQQICAFDTYTRTAPNDEEMAHIVGLVTELKNTLDQTL